MILSVIYIKMELIGWLSKLGIIFLGFSDAMHKIGRNSITLMLVLRATNLQTTQARVDNISTNIGKTYSQIIDSLPTLISAFNDSWTLDANWMEEP